jgi:Mn-dependent DtxR family transcriptional regulator
MSRILTLDAKVRVLRGHEHFWRVICELDRGEHPWMTKDVDGRSNADMASVRDYVKRLLKAGYVRIVHPAAGGSATYRIAKPSREAPRLRRDGSEVAEPLQDRLWRAMKLIKTFSSAELAASIEPAADVVATDSYCKILARAGVLAVAEKGRPRGAKSIYRLRMTDLGPIAPKVLRAKLVYDPNGRQILGEAETKEVA